MEGISLILTLAAGLTAALIFGLIAQKLKLSPIVGYLFAGIAISPYSPGFVGNIEVAQQFADIGVVLLLFGVGLNFHFSDLKAVYKIAVPGAIMQIFLATTVAVIATHFLGWSWKTGLIFGMAISVASTVAVTRVLEDNRNLHTQIGHTAVGWLVVEDLFTIFVLVLIPVFFNEKNSDIRFFATIGITALKISILIAFVLVAGQKLLPKILEYVAKTGNRELFTLSVLVLALGIAVGAAELFDVSMALGAFLAGMVVGQSEFGARATSDAISISDAFSVLFFVSVGMLFDITLVFNCWKLILLTLFIIIICKPLFVTMLVNLLGLPFKKAVALGAAFGQIGEFS
uniref:cation:proton antiporter n=1 Tax=Candidatus Ruminimicrobium bovinum TaxID=3242779 RepID=UPI0039B94E12